MVKVLKKEFVDKSLQYSKSLVEAFNYSVTHFHAVEYCSDKLSKNGFVQLKESENWNLKKSGKYFFTRNQSALFAFTVGGLVELSTTRFKIIGTHTDSPNLRLAPNSWKKSGQIEKLNLERYGGGQWQTWFDRDLSFAGKIVYKGNDGLIATKIIRIDEPLFNIPHLAIHLTSDRNKPFDWNNENHLKLILSMGLSIEGGVQKEETEIDKKLGEKIANLISSRFEIEKEKIVDFELVCYDVQPATIMGINQEYITSGRLDNLGSSIVATDALVNSAETVEKQDFINIIAMFDNEEVGSRSYQGADSDHFSKTLKRIFETIGDAGESQRDDFLAACNKSFAVSADLAHATHPNYEEKHQSNHKVLMHGGIVVKRHAMMNYSTDSEGSYIIKDICSSNSIPSQDFIVRQDSTCGSTIGPIISSHLGIKTVDIGVGVWAMHSIRETGSTIDFYYYLLFMTQFLNDERKTYHSNI